MHELELDRALVADRRVATLEVVEAIDVLGDVLSGSGPALEVINLLDLSFDRGEEALGDGVVPAISLPAHAALDASGPEGSAIVAARVGAAAIGVMDQASRR